MSKIITPIGYELNSEDYYEGGSVGNKGKVDKFCVYCGKKIPKGQPHNTHKFYPDFDIYATHKMNPDHGDNSAPGEETCTDKFLKLLRQ